MRFLLFFGENLRAIGLDVTGVDAAGGDVVEVLGPRARLLGSALFSDRSQIAVRMPPWKLVLHVESGEEHAYHLARDPRERVSRPADVPPELRELLFRELESAERRELTEGEEATVAKRLADLGYL